MLIEAAQLTPLDQARVEIRALCDGRPLWYRIPASHVCRESVGDALLLSVIVPAMCAGGSIEFPPELPISEGLAQNLDGIQRVYTSWNGRLRRVDLKARLQKRSPAGGPVGLFYAGGVDSSYSLISHEKEISVLISVFGFDFTMSEPEIAESIARNTPVAHRLGKEFLWVETNHSRFVRELGVSRTFVYGATLASIALLLGLRRCYLASGHSSANPRPEGSHPFLDHRFSNGATEIVHDEVAVSRFEKTSAVAAHPALLDNLRVCWEEANTNCGSCSKCVRTMAALRLCGAKGPFPHATGLGQFRQMAARTEPEYVVSLITAARAAGDDDLVRALKRGLRRHDFLEAARYLDYALFGGAVSRLRRRAAGVEGRLIKVDLRPDMDQP